MVMPYRAWAASVARRWIKRLGLSPLRARLGQRPVTFGLPRVEDSSSSAALAGRRAFGAAAVVAGDLLIRSLVSVGTVILALCRCMRWWTVCGSGLWWAARGGPGRRSAPKSVRT